VRGPRGAPINQSQPTAAALRSLQARVAGTVLTDDDPDYATHCAGWNTLHTHRPALVVVAAGAADVAAAVGFAAEHNMGLGVQCTGHGPAVPVDGVLVDTSALTALDVDPDARTAQVGAGCTWGVVLEATAPHGLAPLAGSSPTVGAVGYTLGGGLGWLARRHGAACDTVRSFEVVTPDGRLRVVSANREPELFWALRGGGGAFGVVTAMEIDLVEVAAVYGGNLYYPPDAAGEITARYARWVADVPDGLTSSVVWMNVPPAPEVPDALRGRSFVIVRGCWSGPLDEGRSLLDGWRTQAPPTIDRWDTMAFADCATISADRVEPTPAVVAGRWLARLDGDVGELLARHTFATDGPPRLRFSEVRHLGGAVGRADRTATSFGHRRHPFFLNMVGTAVHHQPTVIDQHQSRVLATLGDAATGAAYVNYLDGPQRRSGSADAYESPDRVRLARLQRDLDPTGLLRFGVDHTEP
jgi:hypothetical protein